MTEVSAGDLVFSFCDTYIKAVGVAQGPAKSAGKPEFGNVGNQWSDDGWLVPVEFEVVEDPVKPKDLIENLRPHLAGKYAPIQANGNGNQGVYLAEVSADFAHIILNEMAIPLDGFTAAAGVDDLVGEADAKAHQTLQAREDIGPTQKEQLVLARRGQGIFKANVRLVEEKCRVTGVTDARVLIASHIKPWRDSSDEEKLDGCNGLLLSPHVDRLFDRGLISFTGDGSILFSSSLPEGLWAAWGLEGIESVGIFNPEQTHYLEYHRSEIFRK